MNEKQCDFCSRTNKELSSLGVAIIFPPGGDRGICNDCLPQLKTIMDNSENSLILIEVEE